MGRSKDLATGETRFVNTAGDTMTGALTVGGAVTVNPDADSSLLIKDGGTNALFMAAATGDELYIGANNEYAIRIKNDGTKDVAFDNGSRVTKPSQPHMLAMGYKERYGTTDRHLFHTVTTNTGNHWNNTNGKFTCPVAGTYLVTAFSGYKNADNYAGIGIGYNGSVLTFGWSHPVDDRHATQSATIMKNASANDYFYYIANTTYSPPIAASGNEHHAHFSVYLLG